MEDSRRAWQTAARVVSTVLHPWLVFVAVVAVATYKATESVSEWAMWTSATLFFAYAPPVAYVRLRAAALRGGSSRQPSLRSLFRGRPKELLLVGCLFGASSSLALHYLRGPETVLAVVITTTGAMMLVALVNFAYRASFHLALVSSMVSSLWFIVGSVSLASIPLVALLGLARYQLGEHTADQLAVGLFIGLMVTLLVFLGGPPLVDMTPFKWP